MRRETDAALRPGDGTAGAKRPRRQADAPDVRRAQQRQALATVEDLQAVAVDLHRPSVPRPRPRQSGPKVPTVGEEPMDDGGMAHATVPQCPYGERKPAHGPETGDRVGGGGL